MGGGGSGGRARQSLIAFLWSGRAVPIPTSFPQPRGKSRPNLTLGLKQIPCTFANGEGGVGVATTDWRAPTWCRLNNHTQGSANLQPPPPPTTTPAAPRCRPENALGSGQHCHAGAHAQTHTRNSGNVLGSPAQQRRRASAAPPPGAGGNSVTNQKPLARRGRGRSRRPDRVRGKHPHQAPKHHPGCVLTFLGGGCMMLKGHQSSPPRRRR